MAPVALLEVPRQLFVNSPGTEDQQLVARRQPVRDLLDKSLQMFDPVRLAGGLRAAAASVTNGGIVPDVARGFVMSRHLRLDSFDPRPITQDADDAGLPRVDPDKRAGSIVVRFPGHERAHAGPVSASSARSA